MSDNYTMGGDYGQMMKIMALENKVEQLERDLAIVCKALLYNTKSADGRWSRPDIDRIIAKWPHSW